MKGNNMTLGDAIEHIKNGGKAKREGWNGKEQYIILGTNITYRIMNNSVESKIYHKDISDQAIIFVGTLGSQCEWLASQADMLATDWILF